MNKKYIKRQLVLNDLGIPINKDILDYYNRFCSECGNISIVDSGSLVMVQDQNGSSIAYESKMLDTMILFQDSYIYIIFEHELYLDMDVCNVLLKSFIEHKLNL